MTREELFEEWTRLSYQVRNLGSIVQNPADGLTSDDLAEWADLVCKIRENFNRMTDETSKFLAWAAAKRMKEQLSKII